MATEEQKRRTLEAIARRNAQAEAEVRTQHETSKKRAASVIESLSVDKTPKKPFTSGSSRKGNFSFSGYTSKQDVELNEPAYSRLSGPVNQSLLPINIEVSDEKATVDRILHEFFQRGDSAQKYMQGSKSIKIESTMLLDNYVVKSRKPCRTLKKSAKRSKKHMSLKQHRKHGLFDFPQEFCKFEIFRPLHESWKSTIEKLLKNVGKYQLAKRLLSADLHGAVILVVQCKTVAHVGIHGIVVKETAETFSIVTEDDKFRVVPKRHSVFVLQADSWKITLHGDKFTSRCLAS